MNDAATCDEVLDLVEPIATGELTPDLRVAAHLSACPACAAAVDGARRLEQLLQARPVPAPPAQFTSRTMALVRRQRWQNERFLDAGFNVALGLAAVAIAGAALILVNRAGLVSLGDDSVGVLNAGLVSLARRVAPSVPLYAGATALLVTALGIWWWAERDLTR